MYKKPLELFQLLEPLELFVTAETVQAAETAGTVIYSTLLIRIS